MAQKAFNSRISMKHDKEENWLKAVNFKPLAGEMIIYDADGEYNSPRIKIGDGNTVVSELPFFYEGFTQAEIAALCEA